MRLLALIWFRYIYLPFIFKILFPWMDFKKDLSCLLLRWTFPIRNDIRAYVFIWKLFKKGYLREDNRVKRDKLVQRFKSFDKYRGELKLKELRLELYKQNAEFQRLIGTNINPL
jgi:hypothetical protein